MKRGTKATLIVFASLVLICCGGPLSFWVKFTSGSTGLAAGIRDYKAAGLPWTAADLQTPVPPDEDGAPLFQEAFDRLKQLQATIVEKQIADNIDLGATSTGAVELSPLNTSLDLVVQATKRPHAMFPKDWDMGSLTLFAEVAPSKTCVKLLCERAVVRAKSGDHAGCDSDLAAAWNVGDRIGEEPVLIALLVQLAVRSIVMRAVQLCAASDAGQLDALSSLMATLIKMDLPVNFVRAVKGEGYMNLTIVRNLAIFGPRLSEMTSGRGSSPPIDPRQLKRDGYPTGAYASLEGGPPLSDIARLAKIAAADEKDPYKLDEDLNNFDNMLKTETGATQLLTQVLNPIYGSLGNVIMREITFTRANKALVEALIVKAETGKYPGSITDLPHKWIDPVDDAPLDMKVSGSSIRVYGLGPDHVDHGGVSAAETGRDFNSDIVASYPPLAHLGTGASAR